MMESQNISKALTWDDLADEYDKRFSGRPARTLQMDTVFEQMKNKKEEFWVDPEKGTIHKILKEE